MVKVEVGSELEHAQEVLKYVPSDIYLGLIRLPEFVRAMAVYGKNRLTQPPSLRILKYDLDGFKPEVYFPTLSLVFEQPVTIHSIRDDFKSAVTNMTEKQPETKICDKTYGANDENVGIIELKGYAVQGYMNHRGQIAYVSTNPVSQERRQQVIAIKDLALDQYRLPPAALLPGYLAYALHRQHIRS